MDSTRQRLADALIDVIADQGLGRATVRGVATEAGISIGAVQYYCPTKDAMLRLAFVALTDRILDRLATLERIGSVGSVLRRAVLEYLPLDDARRREARVYLAFAARAAVSDDLAELQHELLAALREQCRLTFVLAQERGEADPALNPERAAVATTVVVDGLTLQLLTDPQGMSAETAVAIMDAHLARYLTPPAG